jgi:DNA-binding NtrC family response regulator
MWNMTLNHKSILVLDDEFDIVALIKQSLQRAGLHVYAFTDPLLALEHFKLNCKHYILVLSDVRMPGMDGFVRKLNEISSTIKVLLMSAFEINSAELSTALGSVHINGFIQKPISLSELNSIIRKIIVNEIETRI